MSARLTKRQMDTLLNIFLGDARYEEKRTTVAWPKWSARVGDPVPAWGRKEDYSHRSAAGGALHRMIERMADDDLLPTRTTKYGNSYPVTNRLTVKSLTLLRDKFPTLPGIDEAIAVARKEADEAFAAAEEDRAATREYLAKSARERSAARRERMEAILMDFQVRHSLTPDQLEAIWKRVVDEEMALP